MAEPGPWERKPQASRARGRGPLWRGLLLVAALAALVAALAHAFPYAVRSPQDWADVARAAGFVLLISAGAWRAGTVLRREHFGHATLWAAVVATLALGFAYRAEFADVGRRLQLAFSDGAPVAGEEHELIVPRDSSGAFLVVARVDGQRVRFLVDTGSSETVLSPDDARRIGLDTSRLSYVLEAETANGRGYGAQYLAQRLELGTLRMASFPMVVNQAPMSSSLLGMSFLNRLETFRVEKDQLVMRWRDGDGLSASRS